MARLGFHLASRQAPRENSRRQRRAEEKTKQINEAYEIVKAYIQDGKRPKKRPQHRQQNNGEKEVAKWKKKAKFWEEKATQLEKETVKGGNPALAILKWSVIIISFYAFGVSRDKLEKDLEDSRADLRKSERRRGDLIAENARLNEVGIPRSRSQSQTKPTENEQNSVSKEEQLRAPKTARDERFEKALETWADISYNEKEWTAEWVRTGMPRKDQFLLMGTSREYADSFGFSYYYPRNRSERSKEIRKERDAIIDKLNAEATKRKLKEFGRDSL